MKKTAIITLVVNLLVSIIPIAILFYLQAFGRKSMLSYMFGAAHYEDRLMSWTLFLLLAIPLVSIFCLAKERYKASFVFNMAELAVLVFFGTAWLLIK